jgi:hypothetical protein
VELHLIAGGIVEKRLQAGADWRRIADVDPCGPQFGDHRGQVVHPDGEVLPQGFRRGTLDQVDLAAGRADIEPGSPEPEVGAVRSGRQAQPAHVELEGGGDVVDVDRNMVYAGRLHRR